MSRYTRSTSASQCVAAAVVSVAVLAGTPTASARPDDVHLGSQPRPVAVCPLERIGDQFVRCDDLTGAGASAPDFVLEAG